MMSSTESSKPQSQDFQSTDPLSTTQSLTTVPASPQSLIPLTNTVFKRHYRLHIGHFGNGANAMLDRDLISATNFPDLFAYSFPFMSCEVEKVNGVVACQLEIVPGVQHLGIARAVGYVRPQMATTSPSFISSTQRAGAALVHFGSNLTVNVSPHTSGCLSFPTGVAPFLMGPLAPSFLPRFDFRTEGTEKCSVDLFLTINLVFSHAGYGYKN